MAILEKRQGPAKEGRHIQVVRPRWTWFEVTDSKGVKAEDVKVTPLGRYLAPAWALTVPNWRKAAEEPEPVTMDVWWTEADLTTAQAPWHTEFTPSKAGVSIVHEAWAKDRGRGPVVIEAVERVPYRVPLPSKDGTNELRLAPMNDCLIVRLRYDPDRGPFFVQPGQGMWRGGQAHRWYDKAGQYTGIFWPVTEERAAELRALHVIDIAGLKKASHSATLKLGPPGAGQTRPPVAP
jgi:hypothetical protein